MKIDVMTLFPDMFPGVLGASIIKRAIEKGVLSVSVHNIRDFADNKQRQADDYPFGGGAGMVMMAQPIIDCLMDVEGDGPNARRIYLSPRGRTLTSAVAHELAGEERLILLAGHYEGVDERALSRFEHLSIGDYVLTGGELPAMVLIDCVARLLPGALGNEESAVNESFSNGLIEHPHYTRPAELRGEAVPEVLLSGHHANIETWRRERSLELTKALRPELLNGIELSKKDKAFIDGLDSVEDN